MPRKPTVAWRLTDRIILPHVVLVSLETYAGPRLVLKFDLSLFISCKFESD